MRLSWTRVAVLSVGWLSALNSGCTCGDADQAEDACVPDPCNGHGTCAGGSCTCDAKYAGTTCDQCADSTAAYPECAPAVDLCSPDPCNGHGTCAAGVCTCASKYAGARCDQCADSPSTYPECEPAADPCVPDPCNGHGTCAAGVCTCTSKYKGEHCEQCADSTSTYPQCEPATDPCVPDPCNGHGTCAAGVCTCVSPYAGSVCDECETGLTGYPDCVQCNSATDCTSPALPACDQATHTCVECVDGQTPPTDSPCQGVCALIPPVCQGNQWVCDGPGYEPTEESCDGFDNDCDGEVDEGVCAACTVPLSDIQANLHSKWDIDFDYECRAYLTTLVSGPDYTAVIGPAASSVQQYQGNANQDMGYALVDPDPSHRRVVVTYSCLFGCSAVNGLTLLYTCSASDPGCGCAGQANCPGFLNAPFLATGVAGTSVAFNGWTVGTPTGLAAGPGNTYYVGNFQPQTCDDSPGCTACDASHPGVYCKPSEANCCDTGPLGRLVRFTLPEQGVEPTWRVERVIDGEQILGLASGREGGVYVGTYVSASQGHLYRFDPNTGDLTLLQAFGGTVFSITQERRTGDLYLEVRASPRIVRVAQDGTLLDLPSTVPSDPSGDGVLQVGPDGKLYRLQGRVDGASTLDVYDLP